MPSSVELKPGTVYLGKYKIIERFGWGSLGDAFYVAVDLKLNRNVLVRILPPDISDDNDLGERFLQQIKITVSLKHQTILRAWEAGECDGCYYLIMEYFDGVFLSKYLKENGMIEEKKAIEMLLPLADALNYVWQTHQLLHRNIRPETVLVKEDGDVAIFDFGLAKILSTKGKNRTLHGYAVGEPRYMSPEQLVGASEVDQRADMYCFGILLHQMLTGAVPYEGLSADQVMMAQRDMKLPTVNRYHPSVSAPCRMILEKLLSKDRNLRHRNWSELVADLNAFLHDEPLPSFSSDNALEGSETYSLKGVLERTDSYIKKSKRIVIPSSLAIVVIVLSAICAFLYVKSGDIDRSSEHKESLAIEDAPKSVATSKIDEMDVRREIVNELSKELIKGNYWSAYKSYQNGEARNIIPEINTILSSLANSSRLIARSFLPEVGEDVVVETKKGRWEIHVVKVKDDKVYFYKVEDRDKTLLRMSSKSLGIKERLKRLKSSPSELRRIYGGVYAVRTGRDKIAEKYFRKSGLFSEPLLRLLEERNAIDKSPVKGNDGKRKDNVE